VERLLIALERRGKHITRRRHRVDVLGERRRRRRDARTARGNSCVTPSSVRDEASSWPKRARTAFRGSSSRRTAKFAKFACRPSPTNAYAQEHAAQTERSDADVAVPKRAIRRSAERLRSAGIDVPTTSAQIGRRTSDGTQLLFLRPSDVPAYVEFGAGRLRHRRQRRAVGTERTGANSSISFGYAASCVAARRIEPYPRRAFPTFLRVRDKFARSAEATLRT